MCMAVRFSQVPRWQILEDPGFNALLNHTLRKLRSRMTPRQLANGVRVLAPIDAVQTDGRSASPS